MTAGVGSLRMTAAPRLAGRDPVCQARAISEGVRVPMSYQKVSFVKSLEVKVPDCENIVEVLTGHVVQGGNEGLANQRPEVSGLK